MKGAAVLLGKISKIIKKDVDIINPDGYIFYSSNEDRKGMVLEKECYEGALLLNSRHRLYVHIEGGSCEELNLVQMLLKDKMYGPSDSYQQFFINFLDGCEDMGNYEKYGLHDDKDFIVYCINPDYGHLSNAYSLMYNSFYGEVGRWTFPYNGDVILVEEFQDSLEGAGQKARIIKDMINSEIFADIRVGVGSVHKGIEGIKKSYDEAREAIKIGKMFNLPDNIFMYSHILAERIISLIPESSMELLCREIFKDDTEDVLDGEMIKTIDVLFKNNLNISDSAKTLYIHRNTLLYRIDKIQKVTGLDIRKFEDAVTLKLIYLLKHRTK